MCFKTQAYQSLVRPIVEYGSTVWDPYTKSNIDKIEMVQRRAARYVTNRYHNTSSVSGMLVTLAWRPLEYRRVDARLCMLYKIVNGYVAIPPDPYLLPFTRSSRLHHSNAYQIPYSKCDYHLYSFFPRTIRTWNTLPQQIVDSETIDLFKDKIQNLQYSDN